MPLKKYHRRKFLQVNGSLLLATVIPSSFFNKKYKPLLSFSTLGCPDWDFEKITAFAAANKYDGIEIRGIQRELYLPNSPVFSRENINATIQKMKDRNLKFVDLGSSATLHFPEGDEREKNLDEGRRFIDLAQQIACPYIRVYPNNFPKGQDKQATKDLIVKGLLELGDYAKGSNVTVLMETHGDAVYIADIADIAKASEHENTGLVWDPYNMWSVTKESPASAYDALKKYIKHTHIKDSRKINGKEQFVLLGTGDSYIFEAIDILVKNKFPGYYSFEWEKLWHPEIDDPEIAIADYPKAMARLLQKPAHISNLN
ncbi:MAG TPA: sugar phosphate isomerase/epimerase family protein [Parafilimonas sp.]|nr:sugar phosphate isomerase/epimerase family protein [Parafilimonas sp.]